MPKMVFANDLPYQGDDLDPLKALGDTLAFAVDDWGDTRAKAWVYGIVLGWDDEALKELAPSCRWTEEQVDRLRSLHERFVGLSSA